MPEILSFSCWLHPCTNSISSIVLTQSTSDSPVDVLMCDRPEMRVGRQLAIIADDVNARYSNEFNKMVRQLHVDQNTAYEAFAAVARQSVTAWSHCLLIALQSLFVHFVQSIRRPVVNIFSVCLP